MYFSEPIIVQNLTVVKVIFIILGLHDYFCLRIHFPVLGLRADSGEPESLLAAAHHQWVVLALIGQGGEARPQLELHKLVRPLTILNHVGNLCTKQINKKGILNLAIFHVMC